MARNGPVRDRDEIRPEMSAKPGSPPRLPSGSLRHARGASFTSAYRPGRDGCRCSARL